MRSQICQSPGFSLFVVLLALLAAFVADNVRAFWNRLHTYEPLLPATYTRAPGSPPAFTRLSFRQFTPTWPPDTTAIILNWSRLPNVVRIAGLLCGSALDNTLATVFIWNNNPQGLTGKDFAPAHCSKLIVHNSPSNMYFLARFMACAQATTPFCYIQDDDYLVWPEIIIAMRARFSESHASGIHLLPPHEKLSSDLRTVRVGSNVHTSFAWLGHGTIIRRSQAVEFLALLDHLNVSQEEAKMADNYYTILSNAFPETWFDQGIELGGGQPFTVGTEGDERNNRHITRAAQLLDSMMSCTFPPCVNLRVDEPSLPYVKMDGQLAPSLSHTPCRGTLCVLETSIKLLPEELGSLTTSADRMLVLERQNSDILGDSRKSHYLEFPLSYAVDGHIGTAFRSPQGARQGDTIALDTLGSVHPQWDRVDLVFLVDMDTETILRASVFEMSSGATPWVTSENQVVCAVLPSPGGNISGSRHECSVQFVTRDDVKMGSIFRVHLEDDMEQRWCLYEVWLRGLSD